MPCAVTRQGFSRCRAMRRDAAGHLRIPLRTAPSLLQQMGVCGRFQSCKVKNNDVCARFRGLWIPGKNLSKLRCLLTCGYARRRRGAGAPCAWNRVLWTNRASIAPENVHREARCAPERQIINDEANRARLTAMPTTPRPATVKPRRVPDPANAHREARCAPACPKHLIECR